MEPRKLYFTKETFTAEAIKELEGDGYVEAWAHGGGFKNRIVNLAEILKRTMDGSDHGKTLSIDSALTSELKNISPPFFSTFSESGTLLQTFKKGPVG